MLEDMDSQLRHQLEKMIHQRNQCSAEKAQRDLEVHTPNNFASPAVVHLLLVGFVRSHAP